MTKITSIPLSQLKVDSKGIIENFNCTKETAQHDKIRSRLQSIGFISGQQILVVQKQFGSVLTKIGNGFPIAIRKSVADMIMVKPIQEDIVEFSQKKIKQNFFDYFLKIFKK